MQISSAPPISSWASTSPTAWEKAGAVDGRYEVARLVPSGEHLVHSGAEGAHKTGERAEALLGLGERCAVEIDAVAVTGHIAGNVFHDEAGLAQRLSVGGKPLIGPRRLVDEGDGGIEGVERCAIAREGLDRSVRVAGQHLGVLGAGEPVAHLVVFPGPGVGRLDLLEGEAGLVELGR